MSHFSSTVEFVKLVGQAKERGFWPAIAREVWDSIREHSPTLGEQLLGDEIAGVATAMLGVPKAAARELAADLFASKAAVGVRKLREIFARLEQTHEFVRRTVADPQPAAA